VPSAPAAPKTKHSLPQPHASSLSRHAFGLPLPCRNILRLLEALNAFHRYINSSAAVHDTSQEALRLVYSGEFPWRSGSLETNGEVTSQRHYALQWRTAKHRLARTQEEEVLLAKEVVLMFNWLEERLAAVEEQRTHLAGVSAARPASCEAAVAAAPTFKEEHKARLACAAQLSAIDGRLMLLAQERQRLRCIQEDARKRLGSHLPALRA